MANNNSLWKHWIPSDLTDIKKKKLKIMKFILIVLKKKY